MKIIIKTSIAACLILVLSAFVQSSWTVPSTSKVNFTIDGMMGIDCNGTLDFASSKIDFNPANPGAGSIDVALSVATINTHVNARNNHLKSDAFFDVAKYPTITFKSTSIQKSEKGYTVTGNLKMKDVTKSVTIPFVFEQNGNKATFKGEFTINRMDYKVGEKQKAGIGKEVTISLNIPVDEN